MFRDTRRKKLRNRIIFASLGVFILAFGIWLNYRTIDNEESAEDAVQKVVIEQTDEKDSQKSTKNKKESVTETEPETYLIKEVDGVVKVFLCDADGSEELYLITSIPFDLLSESDQQLFVDGVRIETEDDLGKFLENFDS
ncbi:MAG: hypothetical protein Q4C25_07010 [Bacillota bacterium]|nr:hypothetical protein [Bacillota bacterium]